MNIIAAIAEQRISEATEKGEFRELPGAGKPLELDDDSMVPPDLRMAYKVLRNAGYLPPEAQDIKDATTIIEMLQGNVDEQTRYRQMQKLQAIFFRMRERGHAAVVMDMENEYYEKVVNRITISKR
ncbi:DUF1992 domain-containing protein [Desulfovibrio subterraneus]|jgi:hypothetical protein|uniref:DUF1992 domain-containing protein n=1 Tax=Desulfovibrio subterraneus TaxID=2718620 RepID=A0A7J0BMH1_9BACT|nr:DnaJ family domain-containing protein [Desulfovibrio subterraneus]WBF66373.1 DUF1992 domain-containing protein [Desulfovibrio subterraneus]GFM34778.1 DUF1992 domain-containing protein [Desulfovibrio subterraneus]